MKKLITLSIIFISLCLFAADQSFDFDALNNAIGFLKQSLKLNNENKTVKANRAESEANKILQKLFRENRIYESEFVKTDPSIGRPHGFYFQETKHILFLFYNKQGRNSIITSDVVTEKYEDCKRFKARIQVVRYFNMKMDTPYTVYGDFIQVNCKILSITPINE